MTAGHGGADAPLSREVPVEPASTALLVVDLQNYCAHPRGGEFARLSQAERDQQYGYFFDRLERAVLPNLARLQEACRGCGIEVMFCTIESLTQDGRDRGLDYKITGFNVPKGSWDAKVLDAIAPEGDEIVFGKTASSVFNATNIDYVLRNLGIRYLMVAGVVTDQCVDLAVRDACDRGYLVTLLTDCCAAYSEERHRSALALNKGYCRQRTADQILTELARPARAAG